MNEIDDILAEYDFAQTIEAVFADGKLTVTLAEAELTRNRLFAETVYEVMVRDKTNEKKMTEEQEIEIFCKSLLRGWNAKRNGKPIPLDQAYIILTEDEKGRALFR
ncbi:MAG: hypothetical protein ACR2QH_19795, partial [Geminicoccaceae bacterium]